MYTVEYIVRSQKPVFVIIDKTSGQMFVSGDRRHRLGKWSDDLRYSDQFDTRIAAEEKMNTIHDEVKNGDLAVSEVCFLMV